MIRNFVKGRVYVFIDAANIFYSQRSLKWRISYVRLREYFTKECNASKMFVYTAHDAMRPQQERFLRMLQTNGYIVRTKPVKKIRIAHGIYEWKGDFDVELTMDILDHITEYDTAILLSGDSDFAPVVDRVKSHGKRIIVMSVKDHISRELLQRAKFINLKKLRDQIELV
ncbi:NYN domain-containing protein [Candidatus Uhrbacteria bacterium]|nr:NYN domain-containing protein [Candidatus Uhrbacteria bacterium]